MTSKIRFLRNGKSAVYLNCYFSRLSSTSSALLGPLNSYREGQTSHFYPYLIPVRGLLDLMMQPAMTIQLLARSESILLSMTQCLGSNDDDDAL